MALSAEISGGGVGNWAKAGIEMQTAKADILKARTMTLPPVCVTPRVICVPSSPGIDAQPGPKTQPGLRIDSSDASSIAFLGHVPDRDTGVCASTCSPSAIRQVVLMVNEREQGNSDPTQDSASFELPVTRR